MFVRRFTEFPAGRAKSFDEQRRGAVSRRTALTALGGFALGSLLPVKAVAADETLPRPDSWHAVLHEAAADGHPVVVLFSTPGCAYCRFVRRDHLRHLVDAQHSRVRVVELSLSDRRPFTVDDAGASGVDSTPGSPAAGSPVASPAAASSPAAMAASLGIRFAPTVAFFGPDGELAERLVGYASADFYGAYLDRRIATATAALDRSQASRQASFER